MHQFTLHDICVTTAVDFNLSPSSETLGNFPSSPLSSSHAYQAIPSPFTFPASLRSEDFLPMYQPQSPKSPTDDRGGAVRTHIQFAPESPTNQAQSPTSPQSATGPTHQASSAFQIPPYIPAQVSFPGFPFTPHLVPSEVMEMVASGLQPVSVYMPGILPTMQPAAGQYFFLPNTSWAQYDQAHVQSPVGMVVDMGIAGGKVNSAAHTVATQGVQTVGMIGQYEEMSQGKRHAGGAMVSERDLVDKRRMAQKLYRQKRKATGGTMCPVTGRVYADIWGLRRHWEKSKCACKDMPRP